MPKGPSRLVSLAFALFVVVPTSQAATLTFVGNVSATVLPVFPDAGTSADVDPIKAGNFFTLVNNVAVPDVGTLLGTELGFCIYVQSNSTFQCSFTLQLPAGTLQVAGLIFIPFVPILPGSGEEGLGGSNQGVLPIVGGTGQFSGASGTYTILDPVPPFTPVPVTEGGRYGGIVYNVEVNAIY